MHFFTNNYPGITIMYPNIGVFSLFSLLNYGGLLCEYLISNVRSYVIDLLSSWAKRKLFQNLQSEYQAK